MWQIRVLGVIILLSLLGGLFYRYETNLKKSVYNEVKIDALQSANNQVVEELEKKVDSQKATDTVVKEDIVKKEEIAAKVEDKKANYSAIFNSINKKHEAAIREKQKVVDTTPVFVEREEIDTARIDGLWEVYCTTNPGDKNCLPPKVEEHTDE